MRLYDYDASGNCFKVRLLLALLGREYERVPVDIFAGETLTDGYARVNPLRETPVLETDDGEFVAQSNAILFYLAEGTGYLPDDPVARAQALQWTYFEQERVMPGLGGTRFRRLTGRAAADPAGRRPPVPDRAGDTGDARRASRGARLAGRRRSDDRRPLRLRVHARRG